MKRLSLTLACGDYDRTAGLYDGSVAVDGVDLNYLRLTPGELFWRMIQYREFDISEMSLSAYLMSLARGEDYYVGIPVFPSRAFRHSEIFVNADSGIAAPEDLKGTRVGVPEYHMTAALFIRGLLSDEYGVGAGDVEWVQGGQFAAGRKERVDFELPPEIHLRSVTDRSLDDLLQAGDIEALATSYVPPSFQRKDPRVRRLFADPRAAALDYYRRTGIFPIMHLIVIRRDIYEAHPWLAKNLTIAFEAAKAQCYRKLVGRGAWPSVLPFFQLEVEATLEGFGEDFWPYGIEENRTVLEAAARYSHEQGLSDRVVGIEEMFAPNLAGSPE